MRKNTLKSLSDNDDLTTAIAKSLRKYQLESLPEKQKIEGTKRVIKAMNEKRPKKITYKEFKAAMDKRIKAIEPAHISFSIKADESDIHVEIYDIIVHTISRNIYNLVSSNVTALKIGKFKIDNYERIEINLRFENKCWLAEIAIISGFNPQLITAFKDITSTSFGLTLKDSGSKTIKFAFTECYAKSFKVSNFCDKDLGKTYIALSATVGKLFIK